MSNLIYKENWDESKRRFEAFWNGSMADRPLVLCAAPKADQGTPPAPPSRIEDTCTDVDYLLDKFEYFASRTYYGGDSFPHYSPYLGAGSLALYLGSEPGFTEETIWFDKCLDSLARNQCSLPLFGLRKQPTRAIAEALVMKLPHFWHSRTPVASTKLSRYRATRSRVTHGANHDTCYPWNYCRMPTPRHHAYIVISPTIHRAVRRTDFCPTID
jgi:hypothetical protein